MRDQRLAAEYAAMVSAQTGWQYVSFNSLLRDQLARAHSRGLAGKKRQHFQFPLAGSDDNGCVLGVAKGCEPFNSLLRDQVASQPAPGGHRQTSLDTFNSLLRDQGHHCLVKMLCDDCGKRLSIPSYGISEIQVNVGPQLEQTISFNSLLRDQGI